MKILVYSKINDHNIEEHLGLPEYSYYFVLREFLPCLRELAEVVIIENPQQQVDEIYQNSAAQNEACVFLSFTPPHTTVIDLKCPTVCVFAWEFSNIPNEPWNGSEKNDWSWVLRKLRFAITHSQSAKQAILHDVGSEF
ncbi:MAG: glycosyltransferase family 1 protein, partial [Proteobacteria bacterium]|nr:glycosyltransferase family 1 protein [Pseudomonadota bacterium]